MHGSDSVMDSFILWRRTDSKIKLSNHLEKGSVCYRKLTPYSVVHLTLTLRCLFPVFSFESALSSGQRSGRKASKDQILLKTNDNRFLKSYCQQKQFLKVESWPGKFLCSLLPCGLVRSVTLLSQTLSEPHRHFQNKHRQGKECMALASTHIPAPESSNSSNQKCPNALSKLMI